MATRDFSTYFLYRWRYVIGYCLIGILLTALLVFAGLFLPAGLSKAEMNSVVTSAGLSWSDTSSLATPNLPYHILQAFIFQIFGVNMLSIKLPSLIIALLSALGLIILLRRWFKPNIAIIASLIAISTGQFLFIAQSGTPSILYIFWPITLLLLGTQVTRVKKYRFLWEILFTITVALSLYTPLSIYPLLAIALAITFHPHLRNVIRQTPKGRLAIIIGTLLLLILPLGWLVYSNTTLISTLLGFPQTWPPDIAKNISLLLQQYVLFWNPSSTTVMTPVFGLASTLLLGLGIYRVIRTRDTTRSYLIIFWIICLTPVLLLNPSFTSVTFVPSVLLIAAGFASLVGYWYRLFPLNPYARIVGLIPIIILVGALIVSGLTRYAFGYHYSPQISHLFSRDISLLPKNTSQLVVSHSEMPFYMAVSRYRPTLHPVTTPTSDTVIVTREARNDVRDYSIIDIIVSPQSREADRFYIMTKMSATKQ